MEEMNRKVFLAKTGTAVAATYILSTNAACNTEESKMDRKLRFANLDEAVKELKKIWEPKAQGKVLKWNQIRTEWPNEELHLYGAGVASGTYDYFTQVQLPIIPKYRQAPTLIKTVQNDNTSVRPQTKSQIRNSQKHSKHSAKNKG